MPNRVIREGITTSEPLSLVSFEAECLFFRLMLVADDFGAFDGRLVIVRAKAMPLRDVTTTQIEAWLRELAEQALIVRYVIEGKPYLAIPKFKQRTRAGSSKYPLPDSWQSDDGQLPVNGQSSAGLDGGGGVVGGVVVDGGDVGGPAASPPAPALPLIDGSQFVATEAQVREFADLYRAVDVLAELRKMRGWLIANPANRKTKAGVLRFVTRWLGQEQDKAGKGTKPAASTPTNNPGGISPAVAETAQTKHENHLTWLRQQRDRGAFTPEQFEAEVAKATARYRASLEGK